MVDWSPNRKRNMTFLIEHLFDDLETLDDLVEEYAENNKDDKFILCRLLRYIKHPNADDYRIVQVVFRSKPICRWVGESLIK